MGNVLIKGIINDVHCRKRGKVFVKNFNLISDLSGCKVVSSAWSKSVPNIDTIREGAFATARGYFKTVEFTRRDGSVYRGREFIVSRIEALPDYELPLAS